MQFDYYTGKVYYSEISTILHLIKVVMTDVLRERGDNKLFYKSQKFYNSSVFLFDSLTPLVTYKEF